MSSAEVVGSGRFSGGRTNFSQMCTLLSQYLKENGGFGDIKLGFNHAAQPKKGSATETMDLFPIIEKSGSGSGSRNPNMSPALLPRRDDTWKNSFPCGPETAQMTIFYGGQVMVFDDLPADKANDIMDLARKSSSAQNRPNVAVKAESPASFGLHLSPEHYLDSDLPIARKNSLTRFLEKRKDRILANAPYPIPNPASKPRAEAWLGLAPEYPLQIPRP